MFRLTLTTPSPCPPSLLILLARPFFSSFMPALPTHPLSTPLLSSFMPTLPTHFHFPPLLLLLIARPPYSSPSPPSKPISNKFCRFKLSLTQNYFICKYSLMCKHVSLFHSILAFYFQSFFKSIILFPSK